MSLENAEFLSLFNLEWILHHFRSNSKPGPYYSYNHTSEYPAIAPYFENPFTSGGGPA